MATPPLSIYPDVAKKRVEEWLGKWNIAGMAEAVINSMKENGESDMENVLDDYLEDTYHSIESRADSVEAKVVLQIVKDHILTLIKEHITEELNGK